jgi:isocitrate dehydrogenase
MELRTRFKDVAQKLADNEKRIIDEVRATEGKSVSIGGYYHPDPKLVSRAMRPSTTFNGIIDAELP